MSPLVVVMGVSGSGKSTVALELASCLKVDFCEGDAFHPPGNIAKMTSGHPLTDRDRTPWLDRINEWMRLHRTDGGVVSCSSLRRRYRDRLRLGLDRPPLFVLLDPSLAVLRRRLSVRGGHFMPATLLDSQLATLERPDADERAIVFDDDTTPMTIVAGIVARLANAKGS